MSEPHSPHWRPIADLDLLGRQIDDLLTAITTQHGALGLARQESDFFDAYTLVGLTARMTVQRDDLWRIDEQLRRWLTEKVTDDQSLEIKRLGERMVRLYDMIDATLQLAGELERSSAEKPLQKGHGSAKPVAPRKRRSATESHEAK